MFVERVKLSFLPGLEVELVDRDKAVRQVLSGVRRARLIL